MAEFMSALMLIDHGYYYTFCNIKIKEDFKKLLKNRLHLDTECFMFMPLVKQA